MRTAVVAGLSLVLALVAVPSGAQAAPSIETIKYVSVYNPPGGGLPIRRETAGPSGGAGLTRLNVDSDPEDDLTANVSLSFDSTELAVTGRLDLSRLEPLGLPLQALPLSIEAVAVLKDTVKGNVVRKHVSLGYDARGSNAPGKFTVDLGSCSTPNCRSTPTACVSPCEGTKTTLAVNVVAPGSSMKLTGELADYVSASARKNATRAELDMRPVPGTSSPVVLTIWGTEKKTGGANDPVETLTHFSMDGNKEALRATARVCRLPGETYTPAQIGDTACDAAGYVGQQVDSRIIDATIDPLPRDVAGGNARLAVSVANNGRGRQGGRQTVTYDATSVVNEIDVTDRVTNWESGVRREGERIYRLRGVPTSARLDVLDDSDVAGTSDPIKSLQTVTYDAGAKLTSADVTSVEREDSALTKREILFLEDVPTHLQVVAKETAEHEVLPGIGEDGFSLKTRQTVGLVEASSPIGTIEYSSADGQTNAAPPADIGNAYVFTTKPPNGSQFVKVRLKGAERGEFTLGGHERRAPWNNPFKPRPRTISGMDLLSVDGRIAPSPFRTLAEDGDRVFDVRVNDLPGEITLELRPEEGKVDYEGSGPIDSITLHAADPEGLFERANSLDVLLEDVPTKLAVQYPSETRSSLDLDVTEGEIGKLELAALGEGDSVPTGVIDDAADGVIIRDLEEGIEDVDPAYVMFARARGLRKVSYVDDEVERNAETQQLIARKQFGLDVTSGRDFIVDLEKTGEIKEYYWEEGYGYDWSDEDTRCDVEVVGKRVERTRAAITSLAPQTKLDYDKRKSYGKRECLENADLYITFNGSRIPIDYPKAEVKDIRYTSGGTVPRLDFDLADGSTNMNVNLLTVPTRLRFCKADGHECLPTIGNGYGTSLGSLSLDANGYFTVNLVDCKREFDNGSCSSANTRISDLRLKQIDFWGDLDGLITGTNGDTYFNTADYDYGADTWNGVPWDDGPYSGDSQPFEDAGTGNRGRIRGEKIDFRFGEGFYSRGAHIYWDWIADDETGDWSPDGTGGVVHCPAGTHWEVDAGFWVDVHEDWCTSGEADD